MSKPDSLLTAARRLAEIAGLPWAEVQPYYRALQEPGGIHGTPWLPKSHGRNIWGAHPHFLARLLFALAGGRAPSESHDAVDRTCAMTPGGRNKTITEQDAAGVLTPLERLFFRLMTDAEEAQKISNVEFRPDEGKVLIHNRDGSDVTYVAPTSYREGADEPAKPFRGIYSRGVIDGVVFGYLARTISWRMSDQPPFRPSNPGDELDD